MQMTLDGFTPMIYQELTYGVQGSRAKTSVSQGKEKDSPENAQACFSQLQDLFETSKKKIDPVTYYLKTLKAYLVLIGDGILPGFKLNWTKLGMMRSGKLSTLPITSHKTGKEFSLSDILEEEVEQKYFLSKDQAQKIIWNDTDEKEGIKQVGNFMPTQKRENPQGRIYDINGISPCLNKMDGGGREPHIAMPITTALFLVVKQGNTITRRETTNCLDANYYKGLDCHQQRSGVAIPVLTPDRTIKRQNGRRLKENGEPMFTPTSQDRHGVMVQISKNCIVYAVWHEKYQCYIAIRKLTPRECFRLQGVPDRLFDLAAKVNSNSQLYKQAGNGVTAPVIHAIGERIR